MYEWYQKLNQPPLAPPTQVFTPVWGILYVMIFISFILFVRSKKPNKTAGYLFFSAQIIFNLLWSPVFFFYRNIPCALAVVILLDIFVLLTIKEFSQKTKWAAILLAPYFVWILFATYLNFGYMLLN